MYEYFIPFRHFLVDVYKVPLNKGAYLVTTRTATPPHQPQEFV